MNIAQKDFFTQVRLCNKVAFSCLVFYEHEMTLVKHGFKSQVIQRIWVNSVYGRSYDLVQIR